MDFKGKYSICYTTDSNSQFTQDGIPLASHVRYREFLSKVAEYSQWKVLYWISGFEVKDTENKIINIQFPNEKRFYLLARV